MSLTNRINRLVLEHTHNYMEQNDNVPHCAFGSGWNRSVLCGKKIHEPFNKLKLNCTLHISLKPWLFKLRYVRERYSSKNREYFSDMEFTKYHICWIVRKGRVQPMISRMMKECELRIERSAFEAWPNQCVEFKGETLNSHRASPWKNWEDAGRGRGAE